LREEKEQTFKDMGAESVFLFGIPRQRRHLGGMRGLNLRQISPEAKEGMMSMIRSVWREGEGTSFWKVRGKNSGEGEVPSERRR
jgi:hypothetical protein